MLAPDDKQNVPVAVRLLKTFSMDINVKSLPIRFIDMLPALKILKTICEGILALFDSTELSIDQQLGRLSIMSHTLLFLTVADDLQMPSVLYHDIQGTVQNAFFYSCQIQSLFS